MVEFTRDMRPHNKGDTRVVPDEIAAQLVEDGDAVFRDSVFDKPATAQPKYRTKRRG